VQLVQRLLLMAILLMSAFSAAGMHGIREDWTVDLLACTYHTCKFAIWGAVEGIIIAICVLGIRKAVVVVMSMQHAIHCSSAAVSVQLHLTCAIRNADVNAQVLLTTATGLRHLAIADGQVVGFKHLNDHQCHTRRDIRCHLRPAVIVSAPCALKHML
jgi:hypothetical protein